MINIEIAHKNHTSNNYLINTQKNKGKKTISMFFLQFL